MPSNDSDNDIPSYDPDDPDLSLNDISQYQSSMIGRLLDYNHAIATVCRKNAEGWQDIAAAYIRCSEMSIDIAESCAVAARITVDRAGDIISTEFDLVERVPPQGDDEEEEEYDG